MKISRRSWRVLLNRQKGIVNRVKPGPRIAVLGMGNELNGDDAAGLLAIRELKNKLHPNPNLLILETGPAPENFTGVVKRFHPDWVIVIDAARLKYQPGSIAYLEPDETGEEGAATHGISLAVLLRYLASETGCHVSLLGIQVSQTGFDQSLSPPVQRAAMRAARMLSQILNR